MLIWLQWHPAELFVLIDFNLRASASWFLFTSSAEHREIWGTQTAKYSSYQVIGWATLSVVVFFVKSLYLLPLRMDNPEQSASSSLLTGPSKECQKLEKASLISSDKCTKQRSSLDRTDQSLYTAGEEECLRRADTSVVYLMIVLLSCAHAGLLSKNIDWFLLMVPWNFPCWLCRLWYLLIAKMKCCV